MVSLLGFEVPNPPPKPLVLLPPVEFFDFLDGLADRLVVVDGADLDVNRWRRSVSVEEVDGKILLVPKQWFDRFLRGVWKALDKEGKTANKMRPVNPMNNDLILVGCVGSDMMFVTIL